jgi:hypothetical protein
LGGTAIAVHLELTTESVHNDVQVQLACVQVLEYVCASLCSRTSAWARMYMCVCVCIALCT